MKKGFVGAGIVNVITESLYDKPIVVFREYVQNAVDSIKKAKEQNSSTDLYCKIWTTDNSLYFLDNGDGIDSSDFENKMINIAMSGKSRNKDIGYKGIGRLSGISYCKQLIFINIISYRENKFQKYIVDAENYRQIRWTSEFDSLEFSDAMNKIGKISDNCDEVPELLNKYSNMFAERDTGFLVILVQTNQVLNNIISDKNFLSELGWLLPVAFKDELYTHKDGEIFKILEEIDEITNIIPAASYNITFNDTVIERPITQEKLRDFNYIHQIEPYGAGYISFPKGKMIINTKNDFKGIRLYLDNILLCDESELLSMLVQYGFLNHTMNELTQTVKSVGLIIYITNKNSIFANARRTFIEITDNDALEFLKLLAEIVERIYTARYAVSKYFSALEEQGNLNEKTNKLKDIALETLQSLADQKIEIEDSLDFDDASEEDKRKTVKKAITKEINTKVNEYMSQITDYDSLQNNAYESFKNWLLNN